MEKRNVYLGKTTLNTEVPEVQGDILEMDGLKYYRITNFDAIQPFFMTLTGPGDHWLFISSNGGMTAGRRDPKNALFPYTTDDKIQDSAGKTGSQTCFLVHKGEHSYLWEPFSVSGINPWAVERNLYKSIYGNILRFEEINHDLQLKYSCTWQFSNAYGFVRRAALSNLSDLPLHASLLDGLLNILPYGVDEGMQLQYSTLVDAYKKTELVPDAAIGVYYMSSVPTDKAEPSEGLKATTVWSLGLKQKKILLSEKQINDFRRGESLTEETDVRALRGAYFINAEIELGKNAAKEWMMVAELEQDRADVLNLAKRLSEKENFRQEVISDLEAGTRELIELVAKADGLQRSSDALTEARHFSNVLYNIMRGGIFPDAYTLKRNDFLEYLANFNQNLVDAFKNKIVKEFPETLSREKLTAFAEKQKDANLLRLTQEYLPLSYSRRHGDPSRPWNRFYINNKNDDGSPRLDYQGNWRDIFQNWEALANSYPAYLDGMICRFLNASTADGFNPYRVTRSGLDWEVIDPDDPWSNIGYWGDHQIIYLLRLLETMERFSPGKLSAWLSDEYFVFSNVPYRIKSYPERLANPRDTISYDDALADLIEARKNRLGADGKLVFLNEEPYKVNLAEKLLIPVLAKLSNLVVDGGIWLNTQRPEWNDANNALVGNGLSMVTVYYLRKHLVFLKKLISSSEQDTIRLSAEVKTWIEQVREAFNRFQHRLVSTFSPEQRKQLMDDLGEGMDVYLKNIYKTGFSGKMETLGKGDLQTFLELSLAYLDVSIKHNKRQDGLYHAYNLMENRGVEAVSINYLQEMLEGQVAILSSGYLSVKESTKLLRALRASKLYREDQQSYILYPNKNLPGFLEKNNLQTSQISKIEILWACMDKQDFRIMKPDGEGGFLFNGTLKNSADLKDLLQEVEGDYPPALMEAGKKQLVALFEEHFDHHSFTGRSGTFFKFEGLGSIYWHMVSKLVLAIQEVCIVAADNEDAAAFRELQAFYDETKAGLGLHKSPKHYGAFPTDPYSHTPLHAGVQQPGMTGQVKEDILSRWGELGLVVDKGCLNFKPLLLTPEDFLKAPSTFSYLTTEGNFKDIMLDSGCLAFTYCQVPVVYHTGTTTGIEITATDGTISKVTRGLTPEQSNELFLRTGIISRIDVYLKEDLLIR